jgi:hypothetical protein
MTPLALLATLTVAQADEGEVSEPHPLDVEVRASVLFMPDEPVQVLGMRLLSSRDAWIGVEGRFARERGYLGRVDAGFDVFGVSNLDLGLGLWMGTVGPWTEPAIASPAAGAEVGLGFHSDRLFAHHRWLFGGGGAPRTGFLSENELVVGFRVVDTLKVYGQYTRFNPRAECGMNALGLGASWTF